MKILISVIVDRLISLFRAFWKNFKIEQLKEEVKEKQEVSDDKVKEANDAYDDFKQFMDEYSASGKDSDNC